MFLLCVNLVGVTLKSPNFESNLGPRSTIEELIELYANLMLLKIGNWFIN